MSFSFGAGSHGFLCYIHCTELCPTQNVYFEMRSMLLRLALNSWAQATFLPQLAERLGLQHAPPHQVLSLVSISEISLIFTDVHSIILTSKNYFHI